MLHMLFQENETHGSNRFWSQSIDLEVLAASETFPLFLQIFMGTFVLSVVGNSLVAWVQQLLPPEVARRRRLLVASMYILTILAVVGLGFIYLPGLTQELAEIVYKIQVSFGHCLLKQEGWQW